MKVSSKTVTQTEYTVTIQGTEELTKLISQLNNLLPHVAGLSNYAEVRYLASRLRNMRSLELEEPGTIVDYSGGRSGGGYIPSDRAHLYKEQT